MSIELRPHQVEALVPTTQVLTRQPRATVVMACGTGKTLLGAAVGQQVAPSETALVTVPTIDLLGQTAAAWSVFDPSRRITAVCSDAEVLQVHGVSARDVTTKPADLAGLTGRQLVLCTYASLPVIAEAHRLHGLGEWGLAVADEAHRTAGALDKAWGQIHDDSAVPAARRLNLTATPRYFDTETNVAVSMDDQTLFGPVAHRLSFAEAIRRRLLNDYRVVVPIITDADMVPLLEQAKRYLAADEMVDAQALALAVAVIKATDKHRMRKAISYHSVIPDAVEFSRAMRLAARLLGTRGNPRDVSAAFVHGEQALRARQAAMATLRESGRDLELLANVKILAEGVDIPAVDGVVFAYAKTSMPEIIQAVGRAMRLHDDNDTATIMIPVFVPEGLTAESAVNDSRYAGLWRVLQALRAFDDRMDDPGLLRSALTGQYGEAQDGETAERPPRVYIEAPQVPEGFASAIEVRTLNFDARSDWLVGALAARRLFREQGDLDVTIGYTDAEGVKVGKWLATQRSSQRQGRLLPDRARYLESLGIVWDSRIDIRWEESLQQARRYFDEHGDLEIDKNYITSDGFSLGMWVAQRRSEHTNGELSVDRIEALTALGMRWTPTYQMLWEQGLTAAAEHYRVHGALKLYKDYTSPDGFPLGAWLNTQRMKRKQGKLAPERVAELDALGMDWGKKLTDLWEAGIQACTAYLEEHGDLLVHAEHVTADGFGLGEWINSQRKTYNSGKMSSSRAAQLEALGMVWSTKDLIWEKHMAAARRYVAEYGELMPATSYVDPVDGDKLGVWLSNLRAWRKMSGKDHRFTQERIAQLDEIGMVWDVPEYLWQKGLQALERFRAERGHVAVGEKYVDPSGHKLGVWLGNHRQKYRQGKMPEARAAQLRAFGVELKAPGS